MEAILDAGIDSLRWLAQHRTPSLNAFFSLVSALGATPGYLLILPILWWGVSWKVGARIYFALVLSVYVNSLLKEWTEVPRPFLYAEIDHLAIEEEYSFPSGHAQSAALFYGLLAVHFRKRWFTAVAVMAAFLIGFSRVYLGVHFPTDVAAGWMLGALLAWIWTRGSLPAAEWASQLSFREQLTLAFGGPALLTLAHATRYTSTALGGLAGALVGLALARGRHLYPEVDERGRSRRGFFLVGFLGLPVLYFGLRFLSPGGGSPFYHLYLWLRFAAIGLWVSFLVPWIVSYVTSREAVREDPDAPSPRQV